MANDDIKEITKVNQRFRTADGKIVPSVSTVLNVLYKPLSKWANELGFQNIDSDQYARESAAVGKLAKAMIAEDIYKDQWWTDDFRVVDTTGFTKAQIRLAENAVLSYYDWRESVKFRYSENSFRWLTYNARIVNEPLRCGTCIDYHGRLAPYSEDADDDDENPTIQPFVIAPPDEFKKDHRWVIKIKIGEKIYDEDIYTVAAQAAFLKEQYLAFHGVDVDFNVRILRFNIDSSTKFEDRILPQSVLDRAFGVFETARLLYDEIADYNKALKAR